MQFAINNSLQETGFGKKMLSSTLIYELSTSIINLGHEATSFSGAREGQMVN